MSRPSAPDTSPTSRPEAGVRRPSATGHGWGTDAALAALVLIWAANFSVVKFALRDFQPLAFNGVRFALASLILLGFIRFSGTRTAFPRRTWPALIGLGILGNVIYQVLFIYGIDWTLAGNASLMLATVPVFITLMSVAFRHERVGALAWLGVVLSFLGVALVVWGSARAVRFGVDTVRGDLTMLGAAVAWSAYTVGSSPLVRRYGAMPVTAVTMWIGALGLVLVSVPAFVAQDWTGVRPEAWVAIIYSGALAIAIAYLLWYHSVGEIGSTRTAVYTNTIPILAVLIAWLTLGEEPTVLQLVGALAIVAGALLARIGKIEGPARRLPAE